MVIPREHSIQIKIEFWAICRKIQNVNFFQFLSFLFFLILDRKRKRRVGRFVGIPPKEKRKILDKKMKNRNEIFIIWNSDLLLRAPRSSAQITESEFFYFLWRNFKKDRNCRIFKRSYFWNRFLFYICIKLSILYISFNF